MIDSTTLTPKVSQEEQDQKKEKEAKKEVNWDSRIVVMIGITATAMALSLLVAEMALLIHEIVHDKIWRPNPQELEKNISQKFSADFTSKLKALSSQGLDYIRLFKRLALSHEEEREIISYLEKNFEISAEQLKEIFMGAHVRLEDNGQAYEEWSRRVVSKQQRLSSHPSDTTQYGIRGSLVKELLFSRTKEADNKTYTWFQLENHPVSFGHIIRHMLDYIKYKMTNQNQGPYGSSKATDRAPIILKRKELMAA
jgi:hypothetical protein